MNPKRFPTVRLACFIALLVLAGCSSDQRLPVQVKGNSLFHAQVEPSEGSGDEATASLVLRSLNDRFGQLGLNFRVVKAEFVTANGNHVGNTIVADDRDKQLPTQWVPGDVRRNASGNSITYLVDLSDATPTGGLSSAQVEAAIDRAMATWNGVSCANIPVVKHADPGVDPDVIDGLLGFGSVGTPHYADIVHAGWMPPEFFDLLVPDGGNSVLGITLTMIFLDPPSDHDVNRDHKFDTAFSEIYYNNHFAWGINADPPVADVETVALHEAGHGLSQGHFGKIFIKHDGGPDEVQFSPFAVMNAVIFGQNHALQGTDVGGHCSIWGNWPNR